MARRKSRVRRVYVKAKRRTKRYSGSKFNLKRDIVPIGLASFVEPLIDQYAGMLPIPAIGGIQSDDIAKVIIGLYGGKKGGMIGNTASYVGIFGLRNIVKQLMGGFTGVASSGPSW
jgi:hypothetical protein